MNEWPKKFTIENLKIETMVELLNLRHQQGFGHFLYGLETLLDTYFDKKNEEMFNKVRQIKRALIKRDRGLPMLSNGYSLNQSCINASYIDLNITAFNDNQDFFKSYTTIIDEESLMPPHLEIIRKNFGVNSLVESRNHFILLMPSINNYSNLVRILLFIMQMNCFFNVNDKERQYAFTNFYQVDESYKEYLSYMKGINDEQ